MPRNHSLNVKRKDYNLIDSGQKTLIVRVGEPRFLGIKPRDTVTFDMYSKRVFNVVRVTRYDDFCEMLENEDSQKIMPGATTYQVIDVLQELYPEDKEALGVYAIEIAKCSPGKSIKIVSAKHFAKKKYKNFADIVSKAYVASDTNNNPNHFKWYWTKMVPGVLEGSREILVCMVNQKIAGVAFLKNKDEEKRICYFSILEPFRKMDIADLLIESAFEYLGTEKPLISIPITNLSFMGKFINKYHWNRTQVLDEGSYNNTVREIVFNDKIS